MKSEGLNHNEEILISSKLLRLSFELMQLGQNINLSTSPTDLYCLMSLEIIAMSPPQLSINSPNHHILEPLHYFVIYSSSPPSPSPSPAHNPTT
jgi:hypothetical protein